jgi:hypothetical protein
LVETAKTKDEVAYDQAAASADRLTKKIVSLAPTTMSGIRAKAQVAVLLWAGTEADYSCEDEITVLARSLLTDLAGMPDTSSLVSFDQARRTSVIVGRKDWR